MKIFRETCVSEPSDSVMVEGIGEFLHITTTARAGRRRGDVRRQFVILDKAKSRALERALKTYRKERD